MSDLLEELAEFFMRELSLESATQICYNEMPDEGSKCVCIQEPRMGGYVYPQIDAEIHFLKVVARDSTNVLAKALANDCYKLLQTEDGFVELTSNLFINVELQGTPIWEQTDQLARKYFYFTFKVITNRIN